MAAIQRPLRKSNQRAAHSATDSEMQLQERGCKGASWRITISSWSLGSSSDEGASSTGMGPQGFEVISLSLSLQYSRRSLSIPPTEPSPRTLPWRSLMLYPLSSGSSKTSTLCCSSSPMVRCRCLGVSLNRECGTRGLMCLCVLLFPNPKCICNVIVWGQPEEPAVPQGLCMFLKFT